MSQTTAGNARVLTGVEAPAAGTYEIDPAHSTVEFVARHLMISKVRGSFDKFSGQIHIAEDPLQSSAEVTIDASSVNTRDPQRDGHLRSPDFLDVENHPTLEFRSTKLDPTGDEWRLEGELTVRGVTRPVTLQVSHEGAAVDPWGNQRLGFTAHTEVDREQWGLTWNQTLETGGVLVSKKIAIDLNVEAVKEG
jgi:polyisoprenoid-binding protein YceI